MGNPIGRKEGQCVAPIALGIGLLLLGLFVAVIVCSRMNDPIPPRGALDPGPSAASRPSGGGHGSLRNLDGVSDGVMARSASEAAAEG